MALNPVFRKFVSNGVILVHKTCLIALFRAQVRCLTGVRHVRHQQRLRQSLCRERALRRHLSHGLSHHKAYSEAPRCQLHTIIPGMFLPWKRYKFLAAVTNYGTEKQRNRETEITRRSFCLHVHRYLVRNAAQQTSRKDGASIATPQVRSKNQQEHVWRECGSRVLRVYAYYLKVHRGSRESAQVHHN